MDTRDGFVYLPTLGRWVERWVGRELGRDEACWLDHTPRHNILPERKMSVVNSRAQPSPGKERAPVSSLCLYLSVCWPVWPLDFGFQQTCIAIDRQTAKQKTDPTQMIEAHEIQRAG